MAIRRKDLEQAPYKRPTFLTELIAPVKLVSQKVGNVYYQDVNADAAVQTSRSGGAAPSATTIASANTSFTTVEYIKRYDISKDEIALLGGLEIAELKASRLGKRSVMNAIEALTVANVLANGSAVVDDIEDDFLGTVATGIETVADYAEGKIAFVCSHRIFNRIKKYTDVAARMVYTGVIPSAASDVRNISEAQMAAVLGVDVVLVGPNNIWYTGSATYQDRAAVMVLPDAASDAQEELQFANTLIYKVDADTDNIFYCESYADDNLKVNVVDTQSWLVQKVFNPETLYILDGIDAGNVVDSTAS